VRESVWHLLVSWVNQTGRMGLMGLMGGGLGAFQRGLDVSNQRFLTLRHSDSLWRPVHCRSGGAGVEFAILVEFVCNCPRCDPEALSSQAFVTLKSIEGRFDDATLHFEQR
jgi:hypothetical protein